MMPPPPLLPPSPVSGAQKKKGIPKWVWFLAIGGVLAVVALYGLVFAGYFWVQRQATDYVRASNPDFEMLYFATEGRLKLKHKPTGREFLVLASLVKPKVPVRELATFEGLATLPDWIRLEGGKATGDRSWEMPWEASKTRTLLEEALKEHGFEIEVERTGSLTACSPKILQCAFLRFEGEEPSRYTVRWTSVP